MATVTFPIELGGSGLVVSDDTDPTTGLRNGGYLTRFVPALQQTVAVAGFVVGQVSNAAASASAAAGSASAASSSASSAASSAASVATLYDQFDDRYLGPKASNPTVDNDGNALLVGAMYFNTSALETRVWNGTTWQTASVNGGTVNSLIVTGALQYQGTLTGGTGVIDIGGGQIFKNESGNVSLGSTDSLGSLLRVNGNFIRIDQAASNSLFFGDAANLISGAPAGGAIRFDGSALRIAYSGQQIAQFDSAGNLQLGTTLGAGRAHIANSGNTLVRINSTNGLSPELSLFSTGVADWRVCGGEQFSIIRDITELVRVTQGGYFKATNTGAFFHGAAAFVHEAVSNQNNITLGISNTNTGSSVLNVRSDLVAGSSGLHFLGVLNGISQFVVQANGNVTNTNNSYGSISDPKLKDIIGSKSSTWEKTKHYNWIEYYLKSDTEHTFKMLGLNAEEAQAVSPGVVDESPDLVEVTKVRQVPVQIVRLDENENPLVDEETGELLYDEVMVDEEYTEWEPNGEFTKSVKYSVVSMQYHRTTQECQVRIENLESAKTQTDDLIQQIMGRVAALESASA